MATGTTVKKWGNSLGVRIPAAMAKNLGLNDGSKVQISVSKNRLVMETEPVPTIPDLATLLKHTHRRNRPDIVDFGPPVGKEL
jgi:antitoxin MazE